MNARKIVGFLGLFVLLLSAIVHIPTYWGVNLAAGYPIAWALLPAGLLVFIVTIILLKFKLGEDREGKAFFSEIDRMPLAARLLVALYFVYMLAVGWMFGPGLLVPQEVDGQYVIHNRGKVTYHTFEEAQEMWLNRFRWWSTFWIWLTLCATLYLLTAREADAERE